MGRKRHSECLPSSVWCFWWWCNASQLPISRQSGNCVLVGDKSPSHSLTMGRSFPMSSIKRDVKKKSSPSTGGREDFVSRSSPLHCKSASRFAREVLLLSCLPFL